MKHSSRWQIRVLAAIAVVQLLGTAAMADEPKTTAATTETIAAVETVREMALSSDRMDLTILYTWTTETQMDGLRDGDPLLSKEASETHGSSAFDQAMNADRTAPLARQLREPGFRARRFAWTHAWPTALGEPDYSYGEHLVRVELDPNGLVAIYDRDARKQVRFMRVDGRPATAAEFSQRPFELVAVLHQTKTPTYFNSFVANDGGIPYREIVLVNEAQIVGYEYATEAIEAKIRGEIQALTDLRDELRHNAKLKAVAANYDKLWRRAPKKPNRVSDDMWYHRARTTASSDYDLTISNLETVIATLEDAIPLQGTPYESD